MNNSVHLCFESPFTVKVIGFLRVWLGGAWPLSIVSPILVPVHVEDLVPDVSVPPGHLPDVTVVTVCRAPGPGVDWLVWSTALRPLWPRLGPPVEMSSPSLLAPHSPICSDCSVLTTHQNIPTYHQPHTRHRPSSGHQSYSLGHYHYYHHQKVLWMDDFISSTEMD